MVMISLLRVTALTVLFVLPALLHAAGLTVSLTWTDTQNPVGTTYTVYRANGACSATPSYTLIASSVPAKTYDDAGVNPGKYCYAVTAVYNSEESDKSDPATAQVKPFKPEGLTVTVN